MALPVVSSWPIKFVNGYKSEWNAAALPIQYGITNTKWPVNSEDATVAITSITDTNGNATLQHGSSTGIVAKEWVNVVATGYTGAHQVLSVSTNALIIDFPFGASATGTSQVYFNNYTTLVQVYAGIAPTHTWDTLDPISLIGTIEQRPGTDNITLTDVRDYVKAKINTVYDESIASWPNDINAWTDFYIAFAERYDVVTAGVVGNFTSIYIDDEGDDPIDPYSDINYLHASNSAQQFGYTYGGNMVEYVIKNSPYFDLAKWMTDFDRMFMIQDMNFNMSIITEVIPLTVSIAKFDINGDSLGTVTQTIEDQGYGVYRVPITVALSVSVEYIEVLLISNGTTVTETQTIDICGPRTAIAPEDLDSLLLEDGFDIILENAGLILLEDSLYE